MRRRNDENRLYFRSVKIHKMRESGPVEQRCGEPAPRGRVTTLSRSMVGSHTFCSWLSMAGVSIKEIQELAGHKTIAMSARYSHLSP
jgi:integrase